MHVNIYVCNCSYRKPDCLPQWKICSFGMTTFYLLKKIYMYIICMYEHMFMCTGIYTCQSVDCLLVLCYSKHINRRTQTTVENNIKTL